MNLLPQFSESTLHRMRLWTVAVTTMFAPRPEAEAYVAALTDSEVIAIADYWNDGDLSQFIADSTSVS